MPQIKFPDLHPAQRQIVDEAERFNVVCAGRRFGKNVLALELLVMPALEGKPVAFFSATNKLLADAWREYCSILEPVTSRKLEQEKRIELTTGGSIDFWSLESEGAGRGRKYIRIVVDEAAQFKGLERAWNEDIRPTLADYSGDAWFLSTPRGRNGFWKLWRKGQSEDHPDWKSWTFPSSANPYLPKGEIEAARADMPERAFGQEFLALFIEETGGVFRRVTEAIDRGRTETAIITDTRLSFAAGVDVARHNDWTVITILDSNLRQVYFDRFNEVSWPRIINAIVEATQVLRRVAAEAHPANETPGLQIVDVMLDTTGVGDVCYDSLLDRRISVMPFTFTHASKRRLMDNFAMKLESGDVRLMDIEEQENELLSYEYVKTPGGNTTMSAPPGMHDDIVCADALAVWGLTGGGFYSAGAW
jgi:Terminase large subunit, T4likevirus-type, N-terminal